MGQYQKGETNLDFTEARDSEWQWHQLGHMQVCTSLQTDNHASTPLLSFKALKKFISIIFTEIRSLFYWRFLKLSGARCRLAYGPADATATHCPDWFYLSGTGSPGQRAVKRVCVCVCVQWLKWLDYWQIAFLHLQVRKNAQKWYAHIRPNNYIWAK